VGMAIGVAMVVLGVTRGDLEPADGLKSFSLPGEDVITGLDGLIEATSGVSPVPASIGSKKGGMLA
jgi:hypothetical protein